MAIVKPIKKNPRCEKHGCPIVIKIPVDEIGNAYGERWFCEECEGEPHFITYEI